MKTSFLTLCAVATAVVTTVATAQAHDTWVETNSNVFRVGDCAHIDLKLGNHGNEHRDFKLASKVALDGERFDLKNSLIDTGYAPKEGYWTTFAGEKPGIYTVWQTFDGVMSYAPERAIKSAKSFFLVSKSLDRVPTNVPSFDRGLEIVPESNPVTPMGPGVPLKLRLYWKQKPLAGVKISFIPEGETLKGVFDARYEAKTNVNGCVTFTPKEGKNYLCVAHHESKEAGQNAAGEKYDFTQYGATLSVYVPRICPCCGG